MVHDFNRFLIFVAFITSMDLTTVLFCLFIYLCFNKQNVKKVYDDILHFIFTFRDFVYISKCTIQYFIIYYVMKYRNILFKYNKYISVPYSRYLDDILNINNVYFDNMVSQIQPSDFQLNKAKTSDTTAAFKTCICQFLMILFLPKFMINVTTFILKLSISYF